MFKNFKLYELNEPPAFTENIPADYIIRKYELLMHDIIVFLFYISITALNFSVYYLLYTKEVVGHYLEGVFFLLISTLAFLLIKKLYPIYKSTSVILAIVYVGTSKLASIAAEMTDGAVYALYFILNIVFAYDSMRSKLLSIGREEVRVGMLGNICSILGAVLLISRLDRFKPAYAILVMCFALQIAMPHCLFNRQIRYEFLTVVLAVSFSALVTYSVNSVIFKIYLSFVVIWLCFGYLLKEIMKYVEIRNSL